MSPDRDASGELQQAVQEALNAGKALDLRGGGSKAFYGRAGAGSPLAIAGHRGVVNYEPKELVLTARAGTSLAAAKGLLGERHQMLAFDPPAFGDAATLGGTIACGLSGPRRPYTGSARDFVLGMRLINGRGEILHFGGEVMKNVAGYDVSRLMTGALGTLGLILEVSLKVLPLPEQEITLVQERSEAEAIEVMNTWAGRPLPISAACYDGLHLHVRLSGAPTAVAAARDRIGGQEAAQGDGFWEAVREHRHPFFTADRPLWRLSLPPRAHPLELAGKQLIDWGGAQRWLLSDATPADIRRAAARAGGHATLFRGGDRRGEVFHPLPEALAAIHRNLKQAFDPRRIFNPGRLYRDL